MTRSQATPASSQIITLERMLQDRDTFISSLEADYTDQVLRASSAEMKLAERDEEIEATYNEAKRLAEWLFKTHYAADEDYASGNVVWEVCDTTAGVISQIDNMLSGLVRKDLLTVKPT